MKALDKIVSYMIADEINSFEECYEVEFPQEATLKAQLNFVKEIEEEHYEAKILDSEEGSRHILYYVLLAQIELEKVKTHLREVQEFLSFFKDKDYDLPNTFNGRDDIAGRNRNLLN